ncbi:MAG: hypothetical protein JRG89_07915 [Deltaproteobacteria bacterium]|nr:hypothetical protein [Deltaproteobacteria bacterium]MBW2388350.1 hypothetical protein [Deltaproteobacteria bacterium]
MTQRKSKAPLLGLVLFGSTLLTLLGLELALRLISGAGLLAIPDSNARISMIGRVYPGSFDPALGYLPTPGASAHNPIWNTTAHIGWDGVRSNGEQQPTPKGVPLIVVGDSFTYGDEVDDRGTWPSELERLLGRPVINGGVFGYGLDQAVLRSEVLLETFEADFLIVSLIADDVTRCEYSYRYFWKPYFDFTDGALVRHNDPVPEPHVLPPGDDLLRRSLRASFLADFVLRRLDPSDWLVRGSVRVHERGEEVSRLLLDRLADAAQARGHGLLVVIQWVPGGDSRRAQPLIDRAAERGVDLLSIEEPLRAAIESPGFSKRSFFHVRSVSGNPEQVGHMSAEGNRFVAEAISKRLAGKI